MASSTDASVLVDFFKVFAVLFFFFFTEVELLSFFVWNERKKKK